MAKESEIMQAIRFICEEKGLSPEVVISTIEAALAAAYRKDFGTSNQNIHVEMDRDKGDYKVFDIKNVVDDFTEEELDAQKEELKVIREKIQQARLEGAEVPEMPEEDEKVYYNPKLHLMISEAKELKKSAKKGDEIKTELEVATDFGRMAAQTAKQVITQKLREAERSTIFDEYKEKEGSIVIGVVQRREGRNILVDLGRTTGIITPDEQVYGENYRSGQRFKLYISAVESGPKGPVIKLSRAHENIVRELFALEIPEINAEAIEIMSIAREAGARSKVAVRALEESIDPIGSCVGQRGSRVQTIINELGGEKIDIIEFKDDTKDYISNALSPAKVLSMTLNEETQAADVKVNEDQLSLAIGRAGQNVRLASKLTGWTINIEGAEPEESEESADSSDESTEKKDDEESVSAEATQDKEDSPSEESKEEKKSVSADATPDNDEPVAEESKK